MHGNLAESLRVSARRQPDADALLFAEQRFTYAQLDALADRVAAGLRAHGLEAGDRVAIMAGNTPLFVSSLYGALRADAMVVPVNTMLTAREVGVIMRDADARLIVVASAYADVVAQLRGSLPGLEVAVVTGERVPDGMTAWDAFLERGGDAAVPDRDTDPDSVALIQYTSGTTAEPKGAMLTHRQLLANQEQLSKTRLAVTSDDVVLCVLPLFHIYALNVALGLTIAHGATLLLIERFDPVGTAEEIARHRATILIGAPPMYVAWVNAGLDRALFASVRHAVSGAAKLPITTMERARNELDLLIWEGYGLTEAAPVATTNAMLEAPVEGAVGKPLPGVEVKIVDRGEEAAEGEPGVVWIRGPNVFDGYWKDAEATAAAVDGEGWLNTGDVGYLDDGVLHLVDRTKDVIIVSGFNVYPSEVEEVLAGHPGVAMAAVVGVPHPYTGESVKAVVVRGRGAELTADEMIAYARQHLARYKCPESVTFTDELPLLPTGKVSRRRVRDEELA